MPDSVFNPPVWTDAEGTPLTCKEKIKVLNEDLVEIRAQCVEAFEDAVLMGCNPAQFRAALADLVAGLDDPFND